jgi:hypothetical protein
MAVGLFARDVKAQQLCRDFLRMQKGKLLDAMQARRAMTEHWGLTLDWHEFATALDHMASCGEATITKPGGYVEYLIK